VELVQQVLAVLLVQPQRQAVRPGLRCRAAQEPQTETLLVALLMAAVELAVKAILARWQLIEIQAVAVVELATMAEEAAVRQMAIA
jgi:methylphosphotriester-DNA--protein-cysteine methyltransferase